MAPDSKFKFFQVRDSEFASQEELDQVKDNNTSNFVAGTMNNYTLYNSINNIIFGNNFQEASDDTVSSTTSTTFQQKLRLTTATIPVGTYRIGWYYEWNFSSVANDFRGRIEINDTATVMEHQQEPKDTGINQSHPCSGYAYVEIPSENSYFIDLDYCSSGGGTAYIRRARLEIWRVE